MKVLFLGALAGVAVLAVVMGTDHDVGALSGALEDADLRRAVLARAHDWARALTAKLQARQDSLPRFLRLDPRRAYTRARGFAIRTALLGRLVPHHVGVSVGVFALAVFRRYEASRGRAWSSSTMTRLGFYGVWIAFFSAAAYALSGMPLWFAYAPGALVVVSLYLYVGNMPCRV